MNIAMQRNIGAYLLAGNGVIAAAQVDGTVNGAAIARDGALSLCLPIMLGAATGAPTSFTVIPKLQDSADGATGWADYGSAGAALIADDEVSQLNIDLSGAKAYVRVVYTVLFVGGTSPAIDVAGVPVLGGHAEYPVS